MKPPLLDLAHMQMELYRSLGRQDEILTYAGSPMLVAQGMRKDDVGENVKVGPETLLFAPLLTDGRAAIGITFPPTPRWLPRLPRTLHRLLKICARLGLQPTLPRTAGRMGHQCRDRCIASTQRGAGTGVLGGLPEQGAAIYGTCG